MEDIIRVAGHPQTIDEIASGYARRYSGRNADWNKIRANMQSNPRIVPIGRSGVYSLAVWTSGKARGGTIRSFVREYLHNSETHIVPTRIRNLFQALRIVCLELATFALTNCN